MNEDKDFKNEVIFSLRFIIFLLTFLLAWTILRAQTWPDSNCIDRPYTKGNDGIIYHTGNCLTKVQDAGSFFVDSSSDLGGFIISQHGIGIKIPDIYIEFKEGQTKLWCPFHLRYELISRVKKEILFHQNVLLRFKNGRLYKDEIKLSDYK